MKNNPIDDNKKDRLIKYGIGFIRLFILITSMIIMDKDLKISTLTNNYRYISYILVASIGACVNVEILNPIIEKILVLVIIITGLYETSFDYTFLLYVTKTLIPDFFASKLDRGVWKLLLFFSVSSVLIFNYFSDNENSIFRLLSIWIVLALTQLFCELGDEYYEDFYFFRHRYSFEVTMFIVWLFFLPMSKFADEERRFFYFDIIAALSYRFNGFILKYFNLDARKKKEE